MGRLVVHPAKNSKKRKQILTVRTQPPVTDAPEGRPTEPPGPADRGRHAPQPAPPAKARASPAPSHQCFGTSRPGGPAPISLEPNRSSYTFRRLQQVFLPVFLPPPFLQANGCGRCSWPANGSVLPGSPPPFRRPLSGAG